MLARLLFRLIFLLGVELIATPRQAYAQADTTLMVRFGDQPGQALGAHSYINPQGMVVHQSKVVLTRTQAENVGLLLYTGGNDSLEIKILSVVGMRTYATRALRISSKDLLMLGADANTSLDCGTSVPCKPNRLVVDLRLAKHPTTSLWVCQIVLEEE